MSKTNPFILNNRNPGLTRIKDLNDVDTSSLNNGDNLVWNSTNKKWENVTPVDTFLNLTDTPNSYIGKSENIIRVNSSETGLESKNSTTLVIEEHGKIFNDPTGFPEDRTNATLSFNDTTRTFTITPTGSTFSFYVNGKLFTKNGTQSLIITNTTGIHMVYYNSYGYLAESTDIKAIFLKNAFVCAIYWNSTHNKSIMINEERHGYILDTWTHYLWHMFLGTQYQNGLSLGNMIVNGDGSSDTHCQLSISDGIINDEDLIGSITNGSPQTLSTILNAPMLYLEGSSAEWMRDSATNFPVKMSSGTRAAYNQNNSGTWQQTEVTNGDFVLTHVFASLDIYYPIFLIQGQNIYTTKRKARNGATTEMNNLILTGLPTPEFIPVATIIIQTRNTYSNSVKSRIVSTEDGDNYVSWLGQTLSPTLTPAIHNDLTGRDADATHPSSSISVDASAFSGNLSSTDIDVQTALNSVDTLDITGAATTTTVNFVSTESAAEIQAKINAIAKYIPYGENVTFQFGDGTYTLSTELNFNGFYGGGYITIQGNMGDTSLSTTKSVFLNFSGQNSKGLVFTNNSIGYIYVNQFKIAIKTDSISEEGIYLNTNSTYFRINQSYIYGNSTTYGYGVRVQSSSNVRIYNTYFSNLKEAIFSNETSIIYSYDNDDTGTVPQYGLYCKRAIIFKTSSLQPSGSIGDEYTDMGGKIW